MTLAVVMLTYASSKESPRHEYAKKTAEALYKNLRYSGDIRWHIAHDGSPQECIDDYLEIWPLASVSNSNRNGYGASYNLATQVLHQDCEYFLMVEDDWELLRPLNLDPIVVALDEGLDCVRLGYLGWTQQVRGTLDKFADQTYFVFDHDMPEPHVWAGHPRLETREFQRLIGIWPEGINPGSTEFEVAIS